ncbi:Ig-like domain-containing protein [Candidatus Riflebacteria bacterium]
MFRNRTLIFIPLFLVFIFFLGCALFKNSDNEEETTPTTQPTTTVSGEVEFPETAGTSASIRAKVDLSKYIVLVNVVETTLNEDGTFTVNVVKAVQYEMEVRLKGSKNAVLKGFASEDKEKGVKIDIQSTAHAIAFTEYRKQSGKEKVSFETFESFVPITNPEIKEFSKKIENALKSLSRLESTNFDLEEEEDVKKQKEIVKELANKAEPKLITICHVPPGNPANRHTITIAESAWSAHEAHGDTQGECPVDTTTSTSTTSTSTTTTTSVTTTSSTTSTTSTTTTSTTTTTSSSPPPSETDPLPYVISTTPAHKATGVAHDSTIQVKFSESVDVDKNKIMLLASNTESLSFSMAQANTDTITLTPAKLLTTTGYLRNEYKLVIYNTCVKDSAGQFMAKEFIATFTSIGWYHPASISESIFPNNSGGRMDVPAVLSIDDSVKVTVSVYSDGTNPQLFKSEYRNGVWTQPSDLADNISPDGQAPKGPYVCLDNKGNTIIVWMQSDGTNQQVFKSEYWNGVWTHPSGLTDNISPDGQPASYTAKAMDNNGNAIIAWHQSDGANKQIFKSERRNGSWTHPANLTDNISPDGQDVYSVRMAMDNNDNAIIVWDQSDGANIQIFKSEYRNGSWTHPANLADNISPDGQNTVNYANVAMNDNGNAIIVWQQKDGSKGQIFKSEYRNGAWTHPANLADNISPDGQGASYFVTVEMDNNDNAIIAWFQTNGTHYQVFKSEYRNGSWTHPSSISDNISPDGQPAYYTHVAMDNNDNAIIGWRQSDGSNNQIFKSEYRHGSWTHPSGLTDNFSIDGLKCLQIGFPVLYSNGRAEIYQQATYNGKTYVLISKYE